LVGAAAGRLVVLHPETTRQRRVEQLALAIVRCWRCDAINKESVRETSVRVSSPFIHGGPAGHDTAQVEPSPNYLRDSIGRIGYRIRLSSTE
jgi:hypothetical protein